jgi:hypothetical protein
VESPSHFALRATKKKELRQRETKLQLREIVWIKEIDEWRTTVKHS